MGVTVRVKGAESKFTPVNQSKQEISSCGRSAPGFILDAMLVLVAILRFTPKSMA